MPKAVAGYRPTVTATGNAGYENAQRGHATAKPLSTSRRSFPRNASLTATETLFNGFKTGNTVRQSESQIFQGRESLRLGEENILSAAAQAYMNVLRDTAILDLDNNNVSVLQQQLKQTQDQFQVGEVTRTDVAQAQSSLSQGQATAFTAQSNLQTDIANYRQLIGVQPTNLSPARPLDSLLPRTLDSAMTIAQTEHPAIQAALHNVDAAELAVKIAEAALYPTVTAQGSVTKSWDYQGVPGTREFTGIITGGVTVPLYDGGVTFASVRQAKEQFGQARLQADLQREHDQRAGRLHLGRLPEYQIGDRGRSGRGARRRNRAQRHPRRGPRRRADDPRRFERSAGLVECPGATRQRAARSGGEFLFAARRDRAPVELHSRACRSSPMTRPSISIRSRTNGSACGRPTGVDGTLSTSLRGACGRLPASLDLDGPMESRFAEDRSRRSIVARQARPRQNDA